MQRSLLHRRRTMVQKSLILGHQKSHFPTCSAVSKFASEQVTAAECERKATTLEQANKWAVRENKRTVEQVGLYLRADLRLYSNYCALGCTAVERVNTRSPSNNASFLSVYAFVFKLFFDVAPFCLIFYRKHLFLRCFGCFTSH